MSGKSRSFAGRCAASSRRVSYINSRAVRVRKNRIVVTGNITHATKKPARRARNRMRRSQRNRRNRRNLKNRLRTRIEQNFRAMNLAEKQLQLTTELAALKNGQDRLACLVEKGKRRPALAPAQRVDANLVPGCLAKLWFVPQFRDGSCFFACDSDSLVVKAIAGLLCEFYSGHPPMEILAHSPQFLAPLGITQHLTPNRRNALSKVWERIRLFAEANTEPT